VSNTSGLCSEMVGFKNIKKTHFKLIVSVEWHLVCRHGLNYDEYSEFQMVG